jgi:predicted nucleotidyltransferase
MDAKIAQVVAKLRQQLAAIYGRRLVHLVLYGSQARGDADEDSDIDVLVVLSGHVRTCEEIDRTSHLVAGLSLEHDVVLACVFVSADEYDHGGSPLLLNVRREGITV